MLVKRFWIKGESERALTAEVMFRSPEKSMPKPMAMLPIVRALRTFLSMPMIMMMPMMRAMGASEEGWKICSQEPPASISSSRMIWPVTVVPTLAPIMMPRDWRSVRRPAPTRPDVMTMVAVDDWMIAVTATPRRKALKELFVTRSIICLSVPEELSLSPSPIRRMPYRNMARPPSSVSALKKFMISPFALIIRLNDGRSRSLFFTFVMMTGPAQMDS